MKCPILCGDGVAGELRQINLLVRSIAEGADACKNHHLVSLDRDYEHESSGHSLPVVRYQGHVIEII